MEVGMTKIKKLAIISSDLVVKQFMTQTIKSILGNAIEITGFSLKELREPTWEFPVVLTSHSYLLEAARKMFPSSNIIAGKKMLNGKNLEKLLLLPEMERVLVLNTPQPLAAEIIQNLRDLGINHLEYVAYDPNLPEDVKKREYAGIDAAISPGLRHLAPANIKNVIDIGHRTITPATLWELLYALDLPMEYLDIYLLQHTNLLMDSARKLAESLGHSEILRKEREFILDKVDDGILSTNKHGDISLANSVLERIFDISVENWIGRPISEFLLYIGLTAYTDKEMLDTVFSYRKKTLTCNKAWIHNTCDATIYSFKEVCKIVEFEKNIRRKLSEKGFVAKYNFGDIWGIDGNLKLAKEKAKRFARTNQTILITGESGTGKELLAQAIHLNSAQKSGPFLAINFAAIPDTLVESELFGYESGAFTGAKKEGHMGVFEQAHNGTLFLDEIGDASLSIQVKLLRVLQEKEIMRVGGSKKVPVTVRIIAATNTSLSDKIALGRFREDLYYRLNVLPIEMPALRDRKQDIMLILEKYLKKTYNVQKKIAPSVRHTLKECQWRGNVRELLNVADYFFYSSQGKAEITSADVPPYLYEPAACGRTNSPPAPAEYKSRREDNMLRTLKAFITLGRDNIGRTNLLFEIRKTDTRMTEHKLKKTLEQLRQRGFICIGVTKQGSSVTMEGLQFYYANVTEPQ